MAAFHYNIPDRKDIPFKSYEELLKMGQERIGIEVNPDCIFLLNPNTLTDTSSYDEITWHLWTNRISFEYYPEYPRPDGSSTEWLLCNFPIAYTSGKDKRDWSSVPDIRRFNCFSKFFEQKMALHHRVRIGFFVTKTQNYVADTTWSDKPWHAWLAYLRRNAGGGHGLHFFDCNAIDTLHKYGNDSTIQMRHLLDMQQKFYQYCVRVERLKIRKVYLDGDEEGNPDGKCLESTMAHLQDVLRESFSFPWDPDALNLQVEVLTHQSGRVSPLRNRLEVSDQWERPQTRSASRSVASSTRATPDNDDQEMVDSQLDAEGEDISMHTWLQGLPPN